MPIMENMLEKSSHKMGVDIPIYAVIGCTHLIEADEVRIQKQSMLLRK